MKHYVSRTVPFGKFKGQAYSALDTQYLEFLIGREWLKDPARSDIQAELNSRKAEGVSVKPKTRPSLFQKASEIEKHGLKGRL